MDFSTDHSFFKTPIYYWRARESRPNPNRLLTKRKLEDDDDNDAKGSDTEHHESETIYEHDNEPVADHQSWATISQVTDATSFLSLETPDEPGLPTRPANPRLLTREHRLEQNVKMLAKHNLFLPPRKPPTLRSRHEAILNTILHKSILTRDWDRAKRAFGLLIRGDWVDVRQVWLIGSDLLLRCGEQELHKGNVNGYTRPQDQAQKKKAEMHNIEYLRRLILQFPYLGLRLRQTLPKDTSSAFTTFEADRAETEQKKRQKQKGMGKMHYASALAFWPVLIAGLVGASKYAEGEGGAGCDYQGGRTSDFAGEAEGEGLQKEHYLSPSQDLFSPTHPLRIKEHLEEIMMTPPWSDDVRLWCTRGMVCLWLADLELMNEGEDDEIEDDGYETPDSMISHNEGDEDRWRRQQRRRQQRRESLAEFQVPHARRQKFLKEAKAALDIVEQKGGTLPAVLGAAMHGLMEMEDDY